MAIVLGMHGYIMITSLLEDELSLLSSVYWKRYVMCVPAYFFFYIVHRFLKLERLELMKQCFETDLIRQEYHAILENMNEGVITKTTGLKYFNTVTLEMLKQSECLSEEQEALL